MNDSDADEDSIQEPERVHTKHDHSDLEKLSTHHDVEAEAAHPATRAVTAQDWTGPDDPENPFNWPMSKRVYSTAIPGLFAFVVTFGSSVYTPAIPEVMQQFHVSQEAAVLGLCLWTLGLACGPMIAAPISESYGRLIVYRVSLPLSMLFTLGAGFSKTFGTLLTMRLLAGITGSPVLSVGAGTNADLFPPRIRAYSTTSFLVAPFLGPALGPVVGGFAAQFKGWRWTQWCILFIGAAVYLISLPMKETYKKAILEKRAKRLGIQPPKGPVPPGLARIKFMMTVTLLRPCHMLVTEPIVTFFSLYSAFTFALLFTFFAAFPLVFREVYGFNTYQNGLVFLAIGLGVVLAAASCIWFDVIFYQEQHRKAVAGGRIHVAPEHRLYGAMAGAFGITIGIFWFAWTARKGVHWIVPILATVPFAWGNLCIFTCTALFLVDVYGPLNGASALAANGLARYGLSAVFPLFTVQMYNTLGIAWATSLLGFLSLLMLPIPWFFFKFGPKYRAKSSYETIKA
ncbi:MFS general substrate transporter [Rhizodiscina lignyota]|uniref:MFS general substrate transporter n=1 Tax=Rhizodiscina lignyota TaxID=1504668 RepID=A0A9P4I601_9PEZI|nr:MFS general substrate transporter [Rhizodiscina lignyota]